MAPFSTRREGIDDDDSPALNSQSLLIIRIVYNVHESEVNTTYMYSTCHDMYVYSVASQSK